MLALAGLVLGFAGSAGGFLGSVGQFGGKGAQGWRGQRFGQADKRHGAAYRGLKRWKGGPFDVVSARRLSL